MGARKYFFLSAIYASNDEVDRRSLWAELHVLNRSMPPSPWLVVGDFNIVLHMTDCSEYYDGMPVPNKVQEFQNCVGNIGLVDVSRSGPPFSWSNKRVDGFLAKQLDRAMANSIWLDTFTTYIVKFLSPEFSDHCAGLLADQTPPTYKHRPFKFFNYLIQHEGFLSMVDRIWSSSTVYGTKMFQLCKRLTALKPAIRALSKEHYQGIHTQVVEARAVLLQIQAQNLTVPSDTLLQQERIQLTLLNKLMAAEESLLQQKYRIKWLQMGDQNTSFFHKVVRGKQFRNTITTVIAANRALLSNSDDIKSEFLRHYKCLLGTAVQPPQDLF